jgi:UDP-glucuronate 4-epimerase
MVFQQSRMSRKILYIKCHHVISILFISGIVGVSLLSGYARVTSTISYDSGHSSYLYHGYHDIQYTQQSFRSLMLKENATRILLTGGAGFIGHHAAKAFLERGDIVIIVDEMNDYYDNKIKWKRIVEMQEMYSSSKVLFLVGDIANKTWMEFVFEASRPTSIVHLAARAGVRPSIQDPLIYVHANVLGTTVLLYLAQKFNVSKFVYASSSSVYGEGKKQCFSEDDASDTPLSPYAATKRSSELLAANYNHLYKISTIGLRFFTVYGPSGRPDMATLTFIDRIARGLPIDRYGLGLSSRDYTYIDDVVAGIQQALDYGVGNQILNIGNGKPIALNLFIKTIENLLNKTAIIKSFPDQLGDVPRTCANISLAKLNIGYQPKTSIVEGLSRTVQWYLINRIDQQI